MPNKNVKRNKQIKTNQGNNYSFSWTHHRSNEFETVAQVEIVGNSSSSNKLTTFIKRFGNMSTKTNPLWYFYKGPTWKKKLEIDWELSLLPRNWKTRSLIGNWQLICHRVKWCGYWRFVHLRLLSLTITMHLIENEIEKRRKNCMAKEPLHQARTKKKQKNICAITLFQLVFPFSFLYIFIVVFSI